jgi:hypothetical protein
VASKSIVFAALLVGVVVVGLACSGEPYSETCGAGQNCGSLEGSSYFPTCTGGSCSCAKAGEVPCCPGGKRECAVDLVRCIPEAFCVMEAPPECSSDDDCPGPPDARCGVGVCVDGACSMDIWAGLEVPSQYPGDCKITMCSFLGEAEVLTDPTDFPDDGNICTADTCDGDTPVITVLPDKTPCAEHPFGVCSKGVCKECSSPLGSYVCPDKLYCAYEYCVPPVCGNGQKDAGETTKDCGGPQCRPCGIGDACLQGSDCLDHACINGKCTAPTHSDGVKNAGEAGTDCGYPGGPPNSCKDGDGCFAAEDCESRVCYQGKCQVPTCTDATKNGAETGPDCGGGCTPCQD